MSADAYILSIDQSTAATKAFILDGAGEVVAKSAFPHRQIISAEGYVSHDAMEIYDNVLRAVKDVLAKSGIDATNVAAAGLSVQRETALVWNRRTGKPVADAVVWQCSRGEKICEELTPHAAAIQAKTGLRLSPYFSAAKIAWLLRNADCGDVGELCAGTVDAWLIYKLTGNFLTDYSNASRTQLFNINTLAWDAELAELFGIPASILPTIADNNAHFGLTDFGGVLPVKIPVRASFGDSQAALFGQGCLTKGGIKATYGTGSSVMLNIGDTPKLSEHGAVTSVGWVIDGKPVYVMEGNINYSGAVIKWLTDDLKLIASPEEAEPLAFAANKDDTTYIVPAFSGLGAPYWKPNAKAVICGMTRSTGRAEIVRACEESMAYQIYDVIKALEQDAGVEIAELRADGGPTNDKFLTRFQSDILGIPLSIPERGEMSALGAGYLAGIACGVYENSVLERVRRRVVAPAMDEATRRRKLAGWNEAVTRGN